MTGRCHSLRYTHAVNAGAGDDYVVVGHGEVIGDQ